MDKDADVVEIVEMGNPRPWGLIWICRACGQSPPGWLPHAAPLARAIAER
jgi:hypothetical protein